jgi:hypothetical protein
MNESQAKEQHGVTETQRRHRDKAIHEITLNDTKNHAKAHEQPPNEKCQMTIGKLI